jgi:signal transduction histidine kinase
VLSLLLSHLLSRPLARLAAQALRSMAEEVQRRLAGQEAALAEARAALTIREQFLSVASHELRTPLTALKTNLHVARRRLTRGECGAQVDAPLAHADAQIDRLNGLVADLLDASRIADGRFALECGPVALEPLLRRVAELARGAEHPSRPIHLNVASIIPTIAADPARLELVLVNLLENARKYSPAGTPIHVWVEQAGEGVAISVRDEGIGIPHAEQERIFERFHRASNVDGGIAGLGLGLYLAREIARAHGGRIDVSSSAGVGSTFTLTLPCMATGPSKGYVQGMSA